MISHARQQAEFLGKLAEIGGLFKIQAAIIWALRTASVGLAADTGMHFYDAETARRVAHLAAEPDAKAAGLADALELARSQGARPVELRIALALYELVGDEARPARERAMAARGADAPAIDREKARARTATGDERSRLWTKALQFWPPYADYQTKTTREIPVVVLDPIR